MNDEEEYGFEDQQPGAEEQQAGSEDQGGFEPFDLESAFKYINSINKGDTQENVQQPEEQQEVQPAPEPDYSGGYGDDRGSSAPEPEPQQTPRFEFDRNAAVNGINRSVQQAAIANVRREFERQGVSLDPVDSSMLVEKDDRTGEIRFKDPDHPNRYFNSRSEATAWCESYNKDMRNKFNSMVRNEMGNAARQFQPTMNLVNFASEFMTMSQQEQDILADMVEYAAVRNRNGEIVGYNCDMKAAAAQARKIAKRYGSYQQQQQPQQAPVKKPATKMNSSQSSQRNVNKEPETLAEAFKMLQENQRNGKRR